MKILKTLFIIISITSCSNGINSNKLNLQIEILDDEFSKWNDQKFELDKIDSFLKNYKSSIPQNLHDSIVVSINISKNVKNIYVIF